MVRVVLPMLALRQDHKCWKVSHDGNQVTKASWNWRMKFQVELPMRDCHMSIKCWDKDLVSFGMSGDEGDLIGTWWADPCAYSIFESSFLEL
eukprot:SAG31_NODE_841_length_11595_cov_3.739388_4_plen_92_part_00